MTYDAAAVEKASRDLLVAIGEDPEREGLIGTPDRMARAWREMCSGLFEDPREHLRTQFHAGTDELVLVRDITFHSVCEHHLLPFYGRAHVGYIPRGGVVTGLSKLARLVEGYARRPQVQERLTAQIADAIDEVLDPQGVIVVIEAEHMCMSMRGISKPGSSTVTSALRGIMSDGATRAEMMAADVSVLPLPPAPASSVTPAPPTLPGSLTLPASRAAIMGILNVTPDSFSDGGRYADAPAALAHARAMVAAGADLIDVGGESTRPNSTRISADEEWGRIGEIVSALAGDGIVVSVDTLHASTARAAAEAGAAIINDVSGGRWDPRMNETVAASGCAYVVQHYRALPGMPGESFEYGDDLVGTLVERLSSQVGAARDAGVTADKIVIDPGLGFSLTNDQCWQILSELPRLASCGYPVLIGASRKRFVKALGGDVDTDSAAIAAHSVRAGAWAVRVHDVAATVAAIARKENDVE